MTRQETIDEITRLVVDSCDLDTRRARQVCPANKLASNA
jgi:hypothetical protein